MRDWKARLENWKEKWDDLEELTQDCFHVHEPIKFTWKSDLPECPALAEFYGVCDGGKFGSFQISSIEELSDPSSGWLAESPGLQLKPGRWIEFGDHEYGHVLLWDADTDNVVIYSPDDDDEPTQLKLTMSQFFERLMFPTKKTAEYEDDELNAMWIDALKEAGI